MKLSLVLVKRLSVPVLSLVFALAYLVSTLSLPGIAANYPRGIIVIILFLSLWLIISERKTTAGQKNDVPSESILLREFKRPILGQIMLLIYFVTIPYVGFYLNSFFWMIATAALIDQEMRWKKIGYDVVVCALFILCSYLVFKVIFFIPTPEGIWL